MAPNLNVVVTDNLCHPDVLPRTIQEHQCQPVVLAACPGLTPEIGLWQQPTKHIIDPGSIANFNLLSEMEASFSEIDLLERVKLLLWARIKRQEKRTNIPSTAWKAHFPRIRGEVSRRDLFQSLLPKYRMIPYIDPHRCVGEKCHLCRLSCGPKAIVSDHNTIYIDPANCNGCGSCTAVCPHKAIIYPYFSIDQIEAEVEGLLLDCAIKLQPRIIAIVCRSNHSCSASPTNYFQQTPNILPLEIPCLSMISPWLILRIFDLGAQALLLISNKERCQLKSDCLQWQGTIEFVQGLLGHWGIEAERICVLDAQQVSGVLSRFNQRIAGLPPTTLIPSQPQAPPQKTMALPALIATMTRKLGAGMTGKIVSGRVPFGKLSLDASRCTGCGICAGECPTDALVNLFSANTCKLLFLQESCVGCGQCVTVCPEKCLVLERVLEMDMLGQAPRIVFESDFTFCRFCGAPVATKAMVRAVQFRLGLTDDTAILLETCQQCKIKEEFNHMIKSSVGA